MEETIDKTASIKIIMSSKTDLHRVLIEFNNCFYWSTRKFTRLRREDGFGTDSFRIEFVNLTPISKVEATAYLNR